MSQFQIACVGCGQTLLIDPHMFGQLVQCDGCGMQMQIPVPAVAPQQVVDAQPPDTVPAGDAGSGGRAHDPAGNLSNGLLLLIIGVCILAGSAAMGMLGECGLQYASINSRATYTRPEMGPRPSFSDYSPSEYGEKIRQYNEQMRTWQEAQFRSRKFVSDMKMLGRGLHGFSRVLWLVGLGLMVGACSVFVSQFRFRRSLVIAALCVAGVEIVLTLVIRVVPLFTDGAIRDHVTLSVAPMLAADVGLTLLSLLLDLSLIVQLGLLTGALFGVTFVYQSKPLREWLIRAVWLMGSWGVAILLLYVWFMINKRSSSGALLYITWFMHWAINVLLGFAFYMTIRFLIAVRQQSGPAMPVAA